jgi:hypothetical protein
MSTAGSGIKKQKYISSDLEAKIDLLEKEIIIGNRGFKSTLIAI